MSWNHVNVLFVPWYARVEYTQSVNSDTKPLPDLKLNSRRNFSKKWLHDYWQSTCYKVWPVRLYIIYKTHMIIHRVHYVYTYSVFRNTVLTWQWMHYMSASSTLPSNSVKWKLESAKFMFQNMLLFFPDKQLYVKFYLIRHHMYISYTYWPQLWNTHWPFFFFFILTGKIQCSILKEIYFLKLCWYTIQ